MVARADGAGAGISKGESVAQRLAVPMMCGEVMMRCSARLPKAIKKKSSGSVHCGGPCARFMRVGRGMQVPSSTAPLTLEKNVEEFELTLVLGQVKRNALALGTKSCFGTHSLM